MDLAPLIAQGAQIDFSWTEQIVLLLADEFDIRVAWDKSTMLITGACALMGGVLGGYSGGRVGAAFGAGIAGATGLVACSIVSLREIWDSIKENLKELFYIILNFLARLSPEDYIRAFDIFMTCAASRRELVIRILDFIAQKLGREVFSRIGSGST